MGVDPILSLLAEVPTAAALIYLVWYIARSGNKQSEDDTRIQQQLIEANTQQTKAFNGQTKAIDMMREALTAMQKSTERSLNALTNALVGVNSITTDTKSVTLQHHNELVQTNQKLDVIKKTSDDVQIDTAAILTLLKQRQANENEIAESLQEIKKQRDGCSQEVIDAIDKQFASLRKATQETIRIVEKPPTPEPEVEAPDELDKAS